MGIPVIAKHQRLWCVTGMHRSGTSLTAGVLEQLGVDFGPEDDLLEPDEQNPHGFWEQRAVADLNDDILELLGGSWSEPPVLTDGWTSSPELDGVHIRIGALVDALFDGTVPAGLKDPRLSLLLPLWQRAVPVAGTIVVVRHPSEVAQSLERRNGLSAERSAYLWLRYVVGALLYAPAPLTIDHESLFDDFDRTVRRLAAFIGSGPLDGSQLDGVRALVDHGARRSRREAWTGPTMDRAVGLYDLVRADDASRFRVARQLHRSWRRRATLERLVQSPRRRVAQVLPRAVVRRIARKHAVRPRPMARRDTRKGRGR